MDTYDVIEIDKYRIDISKLIHNICHSQDDDKKYVIYTVETINQVYMFYKGSYQSTCIIYKLSRSISK